MNDYKCLAPTMFQAVWHRASGGEVGPVIRGAGYDIVVRKRGRGMQASKKRLDFGSCKSEMFGNVSCQKSMNASRRTRFHCFQSSI